MSSTKVKSRVGDSAPSLIRRLPRCDLPDDRRDHGAGRLPRTIGVERPQHADRRRERQEIRQRDHVRADLGGRIGRLPLQRVLFGDRHEARRAIDLRRRGHDHALDALLAGRLHHIERPRDVGVHVGRGRMIRVGDGDQRREVEHHLAIAHRSGDAMRIAHIAGDDLETAAHVRRRAVQPAPGAERIVQHEGAHVAARPDERFHDMRADEAVSAGNQDFLACQIHAPTCSTSSLTSRLTTRNPPRRTGHVDAISDHKLLIINDIFMEPPGEFRDSYRTRRESNSRDERASVSPISIDPGHRHDQAATVPGSISADYKARAWQPEAQNSPGIENPLDYQSTHRTGVDAAGDPSARRWLLRLTIVRRQS